MKTYLCIENNLSDVCLHCVWNVTKSIQEYLEKLTPIYSRKSADDFITMLMFYYGSAFYGMSKYIITKKKIGAKMTYFCTGGEL